MYADIYIYILASVDRHILVIINIKAHQTWPTCMHKGRYEQRERERERQEYDTNLSLCTLCILRDIQQLKLTASIKAGRPQPASSV